MFTKTFSFWRRLVGRPAAEPVAAATAGTATQDDRRLWVRYTADLDGTVQLADGSDQTKRPAKVRDLSLGGANLILDHALQAGQIIRLEMPAGDDEVRTLLACIVRVQPEGPGEWSLGCVFSRELSQDDLETFGAQRVKHDPADQRTWVRFSCDLQAKFQRIGDPEAVTHTARVLNISASGIGFLADQPLDAGSLLNLDLCDKAGQLVRSILGCVVHTTLRANGEQAVGCNFIRQLTEEELHSLL